MLDTLLIDHTDIKDNLLQQRNFLRLQLLHPPSQGNLKLVLHVCIFYMLIVVCIKCSNHEIQLTQGMHLLELIFQTLLIATGLIKPLLRMFRQLRPYIEFCNSVCIPYLMAYYQRRRNHHLSVRLAMLIKASKQIPDLY